MGNYAGGVCGYNPNDGGDRQANSGQEGPSGLPGQTLLDGQLEIFAPQHSIDAVPPGLLPMAQVVDKEVADPKRQKQGRGQADDFIQVGA